MTDNRQFARPFGDAQALEHARHLMIEQQIRTWDVLEPRVLESLILVRRERFLPENVRSLAFVDTQLPLEVPGAAHVETLFAPKLEARVVQAVQVMASDKILEIGTGSGYLSALLACHAAYVTSVELDPALAAFASANLAREAVTNATVVQGNGANGWGTQAYDIIVVGGGLPQAPQALLGQLTPGGRALCFVGSEPVLQARLYLRHAAGLSHEVLFETWMPPLREVVSNTSFVF